MLRSRIQGLTGLSFFALIASSCCFEARFEAGRVANPSEGVPIKSACMADSKPASSVGLDVRPGRRQSDARTIFVTNLGDQTKTIKVDRIVRLEGPCASEWARTSTLSFVDAETCKPPTEMGVEPNKWLQLKIGDQRVAPTWQCAKLALALWLDVDGEKVCADGGAWIAQAQQEDD